MPEKYRSCLSFRRTVEEYREDLGKLGKTGTVGKNRKSS